MEEREMCVAEELLDLGKITDEQFRTWKLRKDGHSMFAVRRVMRRRYQTVDRWFNHVQMLVERALKGDEGDSLPRAGVTIYRAGAGPTDTPLVIDPVLKALGF